LVVVYWVEFRQLTPMKNSTDEEPGGLSSKKDHVAYVLNAAQTRTNAFARSSPRAAVCEALKHFVQLGDVPRGTFIPPSPGPVHADLDEVFACAAAQLEGGHALRQLLRAARADVGEDPSERRIFGDAAGVTFVDRRAQCLELRATREVSRKAFAG
jgi:hypothetical protein